MSVFYMNVTTVRDVVKARGTRFSTVTFTKKDGSYRTINGLFRPSSKIAGNAKGAVISKALKAKGYVPIYSLADRSWRCFHESHVVEIN